MVVVLLLLLGIDELLLLGRRQVLVALVELVRVLAEVVKVLLLLVLGVKMLLASRIVHAGLLVLERLLLLLLLLLDGREAHEAARTC